MTGKFLKILFYILILIAIPFGFYYVFCAIFTSDFNLFLKGGLIIAFGCLVMDFFNSKRFGVLYKLFKNPEIDEIRITPDGKVLISRDPQKTKKT